MDVGERHGRQVRLARAAGIAESAEKATRNLRIDVSVRLLKEDFGPALVEELGGITDRLTQIEHDLEGLAFSSDPDVGWGDERYRLANGGQEPSREVPRAA